MNQENKKIPRNANFFIRFGSTLIDVLIFVIIGMLTSLICIVKSDIYIANQSKISLYIINENQYLYYLWLLILLLTLYVQYFQIPFFTKGRTIGMLIARLCIQSIDEEFIRKKVIKRFSLGPLIWMLIILLFIAFIQVKTANKLIVFSYTKNHEREIFTLIGGNESAKNDFINKWSLSTIEIMALTFPSTISSVTIVAQILLMISIGANKNKIGIIDKITNSRIVYKNKFIEQKNIKVTINKPEKENQIEITWKN